MSVGLMKDWKQSWGIYASHIHWVGRGTGTPKDRDEVNRRDVCECDGWVCDTEVTDSPSRLRLIRKVEALVKIKLTRDLNIEEKAVWRKWKNPPLVDLLFVYHESIKWELKIRLMNEGRCDERLKTRVEEYTCLTYTGLHDKTNRVKVCLLWIDKARAKDKRYK